MTTEAFRSWVWAGKCTLPSVQPQREADDFSTRGESSIGSGREIHDLSVPTNCLYASVFGSWQVIIGLCKFIVDGLAERPPGLERGSQSDGDVEAIQALGSHRQKTNAL